MAAPAPGAVSGGSEDHYKHGPEASNLDDELAPRSSATVDRPPQRERKTPKLQEYVKKHNVQETMTEAIAHLVRTQPENPMKALADLFGSKA